MKPLLPLEAFQDKLRRLGEETSRVPARPRRLPTMRPKSRRRSGEEAPGEGESVAVVWRVTRQITASIGILTVRLRGEGRNQADTAAAETARSGPRGRSRGLRRRGRRPDRDPGQD